MLCDAAGNEYNDEAQIGEILVNYFEELFSSVGDIDMDVVLENVESKCPEEMKEALTALYSHEEIYTAIKQMHPTKASGPDGMSPLFYQHFWKLIGKD